MSLDWALDRARYIGLVLALILAAELLMGGALPAAAEDEEPSGPPPASSSMTVAAGASTAPTLGEWQALWHPAFRPRVGRVAIQGVDRVGADFVLTGFDAHGAVAWWSPDGLEWTRSRPSRGTRGGGARAIDGLPGTYVMGGFMGPGQWHPAIWYSADGRHWRRSRTPLPDGTDVHEIIRRADGTFLAYGEDVVGGRFRCWTAVSTDAGRTWGPVKRGGCVRAVAHDGEGFVGLIASDVVSSTDGRTWTVETRGHRIKRLMEDAWGEQPWPWGLSNVGMVPIGDGRFILGSRGTDTLTWSRSAGPAIAPELVDWSGFDPDQHAGLAVGPTHAIAAGHEVAAPIVSPPTGTFAEPPGERKARCPKRDDHPTAGFELRPLPLLRCFGRRTLSFDAWVPYYEYGGICPFGAPYTWLACFDMVVSFGPGPGADGTSVRLRPDAPRHFRRLLDKDGSRLRITGHFDDPAAARCPPGHHEGIRFAYRLECRIGFVVTDVRELRGP